MDRMPLQLSGGVTALINADDLERRLFTEFRDGFVWEGRICDRAWKPQVKDHTTYAVHLIQSGKRYRELRLHRLILCARKGDLVDHEDGNGLHNWRTNLRFATDAGNSVNSSAQRFSSSQYKGVGLHRQTGKWESRIKVNGKKRHLGLFESEVDAAIAYDRAALEAWGRMAKLNFPSPKILAG